MPEPLEIALVSRADARGGGASRVADDICRGLGSDGAFAPARFTGEIHGRTELAYAPIVSRNRKLYRRVRRFFERRGYIDYAPVELLGLNRKIARSPIIHAHDISSVMSPAVLSRLARGGRRVLWTLHDMSAFTGGCIYPLGCEAWRAGCGQCPQLGVWPLVSRKDRTAAMQKMRLGVLSSGRVKLISPSAWLLRELRSVAPDAEVTVIPNGVDTQTFEARPLPPPAPGRPGDTARPTLVFIANHLNDVRKGALYIPDIARHLSAKGRTLRLVMVGGSGAVDQTVTMGNLEIDYAGRVESPKVLNALFGDAHGLLLPTHADNFPLVMLEALASARAVFAFDTGGIGEAVDETCGAVVPPGAITQLIDRFFEALDADRLPAMSMAARQRAVERYGMDRFVESHKKLYQAGG